MRKASDLWQYNNKQLRQVISEGHAVTADELAGWEYRGVALGLPRFVEMLTWKTFVKAFWRDPGADYVHGWNGRLVQTGLDGEIVFKQKAGKPFTFGPYLVTTLPPKLPFVLQAGVLLDYSFGGGFLAGTHQVRDPLVALNPGDPTQLLGCSYVQLGRWQVPTPSYFTLERVRPVSYVHPLDAIRALPSPQP